MEGAAAPDTAARDTAESDRLAGVSLRLSAIESRLGERAAEGGPVAGFPWAALLFPLAILAAFVAFLVRRKRAKAPETTP